MVVKGRKGLRITWTCLIVCLLFSSLIGPVYAGDQDDEGTLANKVYLPFVRTGEEVDSAVLSKAPNLATVEINFTQQQAQSASAFWTRDARLAAKPVQSPAIDANVLNGVVNESLEKNLQRGFSQGSKPNSTADAQAEKEFTQEWQLSETSTSLDESVKSAAADAVAGTDGVYTNYLGNLYNEMWKSYPYGATGKFYSSAGSCSASVISPNNIIVTAAHCVYNTTNNTWYTNMAFVPAERNNARPYGTFSAQRARVLNAWINLSTNQVSQYDVAVVRLNNNEFGRSVTFYTGWLGRSWNFGYVQNITEIGYPSNLPSGSLFTYVGHAETYSGGTDLLYYGSNMGFGASGSPIIRVFAPYQVGAINYVNGVQSGSSPNGTSPVRNIAPRFSSNNIVPLCTDEGC